MWEIHVKKLPVTATFRLLCGPPPVSAECRVVPLHRWCMDCPADNLRDHNPGAGYLHINEYRVFPVCNQRTTRDRWEPDSIRFNGNNRESGTGFNAGKNLLTRDPGTCRAADDNCTGINAGTRSSSSRYRGRCAGHSGAYRCRFPDPALVDPEAEPVTVPEI